DRRRTHLPVSPLSIISMATSKPIPSDSPDSTRPIRRSSALANSSAAAGEWSCSGSEMLANNSATTRTRSERGSAKASPITDFASRLTSSSYRLTVPSTGRKLSRRPLTNPDCCTPCSRAQWPVWQAGVAMTGTDFAADRVEVLLFDLGGVVFEFDWARALRVWSDHSGVPVDEL